MNTNGIRQTGWTEVNGKRYFLDANGAMQTGIIEVDGEVYYLDESGAMVTGKIQIETIRVRRNWRIYRCPYTGT